MDLEGISFILQMYYILLGLVGLFFIYTRSKTNPNKIRTFTRDSSNTGVMSQETRTLCCCRTTLSLLKVSTRTRSQQHMLSPFCSSGVADGVGGWRDYGVDPSQFSATLMRTCERLVKEGRFTPSNPVGILTSGYYELLQNKVPLLGEYTHRECTTLRVFIIIRTNRDGVSHVSHVNRHTLEKKIT